MSKNWLYSNQVNVLLKGMAAPKSFGVAVFVLLFPLVSHGQNSPYTSGHDFLTTYMDVRGRYFFDDSGAVPDTLGKERLYLVGANEACVTVKIPGQNFKQTFHVPKDSIVAVLLPPLVNYPFETLRNRAVFLESNTPVSLIQGSNIGGGLGDNNRSSEFLEQTEASAIVPHSAHNPVNTTRYLFSSSSQQIRLHTPYITLLTPWVVVNGAKENEIEIYFAAMRSYPSGLWFPGDTTVNYTFDPSDITAFRSDHIYGPSFWGLHNEGLAKSKKHFYKVFTLAKEVQNGPTLTGSGSNGTMYEDAQPPDNYGYSFHVPPIEGNYGNMLSLFALEDSTFIYYNGMPGTWVDSLGRFDTCIIGPMHITSNKPLFGYLGPCADEDMNNNFYSAFSVTMAPDDQLITESLFLTLDEPDTLNHYMLGVVTKTNAISEFRLNGLPVGAGVFTPFPTDPGWSYANIEIPTGIHRAQSDSGFHGFQYTYYIHPDHPNNTTPFPSYGYVLPQVTSWPVDSFVHEAGVSPDSLVPFQDFNHEPCPGEVVYFRASHQRHTTWVWDFDDGNTLLQKTESERAPVISHAFASPGQYWVRITDSAGCTEPDSVLVTVQQTAVADFEAEVFTDCQGTTITLQNRSSGANSYTWQWPGGSSTQTNPRFQYSGTEDEITITLIAHDEHCTDTLVKKIEITAIDFDPATIPNVFTPNSDGRNDAFCIPGTEGFFECFKVQIFNRWGQTVFETSNPLNCWEATGQPDGVYYYILTVGDETYKGAVHVGR